MKKQALGLCFIFWTLAVSAGPSEYQCSVQQAAEVDATGKMKTYKPSPQLSFAVSRRTGAIIGAPFSNTISPATTNVQVIDYGSKEQSFKVLSVYKGTFTNADYLIIEEFSESQEKPFRGMSMSSIYTGTCK
jgi:hypothetical protein